MRAAKAKFLPNTHIRHYIVVLFYRAELYFNVLTKYIPESVAVFVHMRGPACLRVL